MIEGLIIFAAIIIVAGFITDVVNVIIDLLGLHNQDREVIITDFEEFEKQLDDSYLEATVQIYSKYVPEMITDTNAEGLYIVQNDACGELFSGMEENCMTYLAAYSVALEHLLTNENITLEDIVAAYYHSQAL